MKQIIIMRSYTDLTTKEQTFTGWGSAMIKSLGDARGLQIDVEWPEQYPVGQEFLADVNVVKHHQIVPQQVGEFTIGEEFIPVYMISPFEMLPFHAPIKVTGITKFEMRVNTETDEETGVEIITEWYYFINDVRIREDESVLEKFALNEGFVSLKAFKDYFASLGRFLGYAICWNPSITY
jgi:hypothetical protein